MKKLSEIYKELGIDFSFPIEIKDAKGNQTYFETSRGSVASVNESIGLAKAIIERDTHKWRWHSTGAGMGWVCDGECDGHHRYTGDDNPPPKYGCARPQNRCKERHS